MSTNAEDQAIIKGLRALMKEKKVSVRVLSEGIEVPYRTLQNYLTGQARFPAAVFLKACSFLGVDQHYVISKTFELSHWDLVDAVIRVFAPVLDLIEVDMEGNITALLPTPSTDESHRAVTSAIISSRLSKEYAQLRYDTLLHGAGRRPPLRASDFEKQVGQKVGQKQRRARKVGQ